MPTEEKPGWFEREASELDPGESDVPHYWSPRASTGRCAARTTKSARCFLLALEDGGESRSDPIANLLSVALDEGDESAVHEYDAELRQLARHDAVSSLMAIWSPKPMSSTVTRDWPCAGATSPSPTTSQKMTRSITSS